MRIGIIAPEYPPMLGGMAELARGLTSALAASNPVRIYSFPARPDSSAPTSPPGPHVDRLTGRPWKDLPLLAEDEGEVDAWLAMNAGLVPLAADLSKPFFAYFHGNDFLNPFLPCGPKSMETLQRPYMAGPRHTLRRRSIRRHLPAVRHVLTNSRQTADLIELRMGLSPERLSVVHPGVGESFFQDRDSRSSSEALHLLTVSRLSRHTRRKNVDGVLAALALIGDRFPWTYTVVGGGDDLERHEILARDLGIGDRVTFAGSVDFEDLLAAYRRADLFVLASRATEKDVEGFGIVYIEASASGVPVICSREGGATDAVRDGVNGILIDRSTPKAIAAGIERFVAEREHLRPETARAMAEEFRWPRIAAQVREVLARHTD